MTLNTVSVHTHINTVPSSFKAAYTSLGQRCRSSNHLGNVRLVKMVLAGWHTSVGVENTSHFVHVLLVCCRFKIRIVSSVAAAIGRPRTILLSRSSAILLLVLFLGPFSGFPPVLLGYNPLRINSVSRLMMRL